MSDTSYNKFNTSTRPTLVANWLEERALKEFSGVGR
jgi:hypothetical protein